MTERRDEALTGDVIEPGSGNVRAYSWEWSELPGTSGRSRLPWFGIFLVVLGALLLLRTLFPALETAGSLFFLAIGVAFLVSWAINRGMGSLYLGSIITALAAPDLLIAAGAPDQSGLGTLCLGAAFLFIALVRGATGHGIGWQAGLGVLLVAVGASSYAIPGINDLVWPIVIVILGVILLFRANAARA
jgi:hypothetical protein